MRLVTPLPDFFRAGVFFQLAIFIGISLTCQRWSTTESQLSTSESQWQKVNGQRWISQRSTANGFSQSQL